MSSIPRPRGSLSTNRGTTSKSSSTISNASTLVEHQDGHVTNAPASTYERVITNGSAPTRNRARSHNILADFRPIPTSLTPEPASSHDSTRTGRRETIAASGHEQPRYVSHRDSFVQPWRYPEPGDRSYRGPLSSQPGFMDLMDILRQDAVNDRITRESALETPRGPPRPAHLGQFTSAELWAVCDPNKIYNGAINPRRRRFNSLGQEVNPFGQGNSPLRQEQRERDEHERRRRARVERRATESPPTPRTPTSRTSRTTTITPSFVTAPETQSQVPSASLPTPLPRPPYIINPVTTAQSKSYWAGRFSTAYSFLQTHEADNLADLTVPQRQAWNDADRNRPGGEWAGPPPYARLRSNPAEQQLEERRIRNVCNALRECCRTPEARYSLTVSGVLTAEIQVRMGRPVTVLGDAPAATLGAEKKKETPRVSKMKTETSTPAKKETSGKLKPPRSSKADSSSSATAPAPAPSSPLWGRGWEWGSVGRKMDGRMKGL